MNKGKGPQGKHRQPLTVVLVRSVRFPYHNINNIRIEQRRNSEQKYPPCRVGEEAAEDRVKVKVEAEEVIRE